MKELETYIETYFGVHKQYLSDLSSLFKTQRLDPGHMWCKAGKVHRSLSFIRSGYVRIYKETEKKEITQWVMSPGFFLADLRSLIFHREANWNMETLSTCELYTIQSEEYDKILELIPEWETLEKQFIAKCFITLENRIFGFLSQTAQHRYDSLFKQMPEIFNHVPLNYLASMMGMTPETLSRIRAKTS